MTIVHSGYLDVQVSKENLINIQWAIGGLVGAFPEEKFIPKLSVLIEPRGLPSWNARTRKAGIGYRTMYHY
jgi:hypothetical protein